MNLHPKKNKFYMIRNARLVFILFICYDDINKLSNIVMQNKGCDKYGLLFFLTYDNKQRKISKFPNTGKRNIHN